MRALGTWEDNYLIKLYDFTALISISFEMEVDSFGKENVVMDFNDT